MDFIKYSIIIPLYNGENTIIRTLESVLSQTYDNYEVIIVNDGSTDNFFNRLEPYLTNPKIELINKINSGVSAARNTGIQHSNGEYLIFLDADDMLPIYLLFNINKLLNEKSYFPDIIFGNYQRFDNNMEYFDEIKLHLKSNLVDIKGHSIWNELYTNSNFVQPIMAQIYNAKFIKNNNLYFDSNLFIGEDLDWRYRVLLKSNTYIYLNNTMYNYCENNNLSVTNTPFSFKKFKNTLEQINKDFTLCEYKENSILYKINSEDFINLGLKIHLINNKIEKKDAIKLYKQYKRNLKYVKSIKYYIAKIFITLFGVNLFVNLFGFVHKIKCIIMKKSII